MSNGVDYSEKGESDKTIRVHELRIENEHYDAIREGIMTHEVLFNDRGFKKGALLVMHRYNPITRERVGGALTARVSCVMTHEDLPHAIKDGYCVMSIKFMHEYEL